MCHLAGHLDARVENIMEVLARFVGEEIDALAHMARSRSHLPDIVRIVAEADRDRELRVALTMEGEVRRRGVFNAQGCPFAARGDRKMGPGFGAADPTGLRGRYAATVNRWGPL